MDLQGYMTRGYKLDEKHQFKCKKCGWEGCRSETYELSCCVTTSFKCSKCEEFLYGYIH
jgi:hypothetical protein